MLDALKRRVCEANLDLVRRGLVLETWGNASALDRPRGLVVIKPSGVDYAAMQPRDMVVVDLATGAVVEGRWKPSSDTATHRVLYQAFPAIGGVAHTHSLHATAWAQARRSIPPLGTTHADAWRGPVPCTRPLRPAEIRGDYEANTGRVIAEAFRRLDPLECPAALVASHGPFTWGRSVEDAVAGAAVLEFVARLAGEALRLQPRLPAIPKVLLDRHFLRKHGPGASYGQNGANPSPARPRAKAPSPSEGNL
ncbi:MAG: L-ribulose-5-phosphate 4-epimerase AraD [Verrucomicrobiae bacterium]|nr:L-ribulose-5-phosphate 4-epimerase AraD [Verrucomicrobiae bacterium]